jgi:diguanylate cyclase (GGDEF)-like protein
MSELVIRLVQLNALPVCIIIFLGINLVINDAYEKELTKHFAWTLLILIGLLFCDNMSFQMQVQELGNFMRILNTVLGYNFRLYLLLTLFIIILRNSKFKYKFILCIPAIITTLVSISAFFTHLMFWYDDQGRILRGPLSFTPHIMAGLVSLFIFFYGIIIFRAGRRNEGIVVCIAIITATLATAFETVCQIEGILTGVVGLNVTFLYLYIHLENFKLDILTGTYNRMSLYADVQKLPASGELTILSIDMNDLKKINDTEGHHNGDKAIKAITEMIRNNLIKGCRLYRVGGDEFLVTCIGKTSDEIDCMVSNMKKEMETSKYSFSIGRADRIENETFDQLYLKADSLMYEDKREFKMPKSE